MYFLLKTRTKMKDNILHKTRVNIFSHFASSPGDISGVMNVQVLLENSADDVQHFRRTHTHTHTHTQQPEHTLLNPLSNTSEFKMM